MLSADCIVFVEVPQQKMSPYGSDAVFERCYMLAVGAGFPDELMGFNIFHHT